MENSRRDFLRKGALLGAGALAASQMGFASLLAEDKASNPIFTLPDLPYAYNALEPYIDMATMQIHHGKHHAGYVKNLNAAVEKERRFPATLEEVFANISKYNDAIRNNAGGHWNHTLFWNLMRQGQANNVPMSALAVAIQTTFGSFENFKEKFKAESLARFGSGWTWLVKDHKGELKIMSTPNQDNPLMLGKKGGKPVLGLDVWEHAYYLKYQNKRADYIDNFWYVINWDYAGSRFAV